MITIHGMKLYQYDLLYGQTVLKGVTDEKATKEMVDYFINRNNDYTAGYIFSI